MDGVLATTDRHGKTEALVSRRVDLHIERFNLTWRMSLRRFTRLTNGHSKSLRHDKAMQSLFAAWYDFGRKHEALGKQTPAMALRLTDHVWTIKELIERAAQLGV
jgi:transposase InsO family protein